MRHADRVSGEGQLHAPARRQPEPDVLPVFLREHGHGHRHPADRGDTAADDELWRNVDRDGHGRVRHYHEHPYPPQDRGIMSTRFINLGAFLLAGLLVAVIPRAHALNVDKYPALQSLIDEMAEQYGYAPQKLRKPFRGAHI